MVKRILFSEMFAKASKFSLTSARNIPRLHLSTVSLGTVLRCLSISVESEPPEAGGPLSSSLGLASLLSVCAHGRYNKQGLESELWVPILLLYFLTLGPWQIPKLPKSHYSVKWEITSSYIAAIKKTLFFFFLMILSL